VDQKLNEFGEGFRTVNATQRGAVTLEGTRAQQERDLPILLGGESRPEGRWNESSRKIVHSRIPP